MLKRKVYSELLKWKEQRHTERVRKCLLLKGARQVGKSFIIEEFGRKEYASFLKSIQDNPFQGDWWFGEGIRKVRLAVASKGKGKSGGMRVITFSVDKITDEIINVTLLYIYDKKEMENVSDEFIRYLLEQ